MYMKTELTQKRLKELVNYDWETGIFTHKGTRAGGGKPWSVAGGILRRGKKPSYWQMQLDGVHYLAHRLAWLWMCGEWPDCYIDHEDRDGLNNRWSNLRAATNSLNQRNTRKAKNNTTGVTGVYLTQSKRSPYFASICIKGCQTHLGCFKTIEEATEARRAAEKQHGYHENHGR
jgi:hypothetical protein